ncbi:glycoside hydrolase family 28 protein [Gonapodya prolifera JEL478]|uniref:Glycoside hydrolase family 28 protein n=1 Tax=Gonapodya prolifera (strain JEL478) TaxID=1344416 RepID=A0A139AQN0_GONPJ|nr:glycoside hydrolase family 28 protein [Gonapodya prolifera JEL478]|eukprot:KXS19046.1 glycoside hydrolase family 28 protein [Gonapodya prolifera JEL478]
MSDRRAAGRFWGGAGYCPGVGGETAQCVINSYDTVTNCLSSSNIVFQGRFTVPSNQVINMTNLVSGAKLTVKGTITWAPGTLNKTNWLFNIGGSGVTFDGTGATFDGNGAAYWDGLGGNGGAPKPKMFQSFLTGNSLVKGIKILNAPVNVFTIFRSDTTFDHITVDDSAGDPVNGQEKGHNTDAFDVSATNIVIQNCVVVNQDDCLAVNQGSNINFINNKCTGGHGISVGSIGTGKTVSDVLVQNCTLNSEDNGPTGVPGTGMPISNVTAINVHGTMAAGSKNNIYILCAACSQFTFTKVSITGAPPNCTGINSAPRGCKA